MQKSSGFHGKPDAFALSRVSVQNDPVLEAINSSISGVQSLGALLPPHISPIGHTFDLDLNDIAGSTPWLKKSQKLEDFLATYLRRAQRNQADLLQALGGVLEGLSLYIGPSGGAHLYPAPI